MNRQGAEDAKPREPDAELDGAARAVVDAALEVHRVLGPGFLESVYEKALDVELGVRGVSYERQRRVPLMYKSVDVGETRLDFLVAGRLIVELKACAGLLPIHMAQLFSYLKAANCSLGLLINFNERFLRQGIRRVVLTL
jgi:GxxExxY protein